MKKAILAATMALLAASVLCADPADALVGADLADRTIQRYTVVVRAPKSRCTGVVLAQDIVLTAAHCVASGDKFWVGEGNQALPPWLISTAEQSKMVVPPSLLSTVDQVVPHPLFDSKDSRSPDLAILKLAKPLPDRFSPAALSARDLAEGDHLIAAGYGKSSPDEVRASPVLRMVLLQVTRADRGWATLTKFGDDPAASAPGDSGGPLFTYRGMHALVGLISAGSNKLTRAVSLAAYYGWIKETQERLGGR
ncbi:trypsin-like serine protease [Bradyrhizobium lablabi]|uniref:trypsin-like serine protease n=1 Tax=Bradyrhizobium lablabi TaxID=722472 RepID=UPI001BA80614|nr:trypsin-like serine protease [Bradyrhizobium lablabi]MBR1123660.1 trypsin-like serine protease [Bradyrhizobium lablabi]